MFWSFEKLFDDAMLLPCPALQTSPGLQLSFAWHLEALRNAERDTAMNGTYQSAIDRLGALVHRLNEQQPPKVIGMTPAPQTEASVRVTVRASRSKRR